MPWESPSIRFRCFLRTSLTRLPLTHRRRANLKPQAEPDDALAEKRGNGWRSVRTFPPGERRAQDATRLSHGTVVGCTAVRVPLDWHERRMRRRRMRLVLRIDG